MKSMNIVINLAAKGVVSLALLLAFAQPAAAQWVTGGGGSINYTGGNVGIGTAAPQQLLHLLGNVGGNAPVRAMSQNTNAAGFADFFMFNSSGLFNGFQIAGPNVLGNQFGSPQANMAKFVSSASLFAIGTNVASPVIFGTNDVERIRITPSGNVGIGTNNPAFTLEVVGTISATSVIGATYQDFAEWVPSAEPMAAGTVVVLNSDKNNEVMPSFSAYDTKVAGVVSDHPGILLGVASNKKAQVATTGRVKVFVDAAKAPIHIGDLLVTSDKPGVAMRSEPIEIQGRKFHQPGTVIGKALEPLASGEGKILVLLSLQ